MNGCRWTVGNGSNIKVMSNPWLRGREGAWVQSPQVQGAHNITVKELMLPNEKRWDRVKIESIFPLDVVNRILEIPLFDIVEEDKLVWVDSMDGQYSVKSGYNMLLNSIGRAVDLKKQEDWNCLWKIHAPSKAKNLLWRICKGCLPTRTRLQGSDSIQARHAAGLEHVIAARSMQVQTAEELIKSICQGEDKDTAGLFAMLVWVLWNNRNNSVWQDTKEEGSSLGFKAKYMWEEWSSVQRCQSNRPRVDSQAQQPDLTWQKPPSGWYKCNVDAGFYDELNKTSASWCLRDHMGRFVRAGTLWNEGKCSIMEGEATALLVAMKEMEHMGITHVIFETDSKSVVDATHTLRVGASEFSSLICNIQNVLLLNSYFMVKFIKRQANMVAHTLARAAISWPSRCTIEMLPLCITSFLNNEMI
ncbi:cytochrome p450 [Trifolium pratense]|uniref:Cytochrome p450 n=1 Tax=Trifolium pratense TaxID=57577 RepID=A0A2K3MTY8_TRIPR|nr:cytochrome p450 [Trifolium pratense]